MGSSRLFRSRFASSHPASSGRPLSRTARHVVGACAVIGAVLALGSVPAAAHPPRRPSGTPAPTSQVSTLASGSSCRLAAGQGRVGSTWPQTRLEFQRVWPITRGAGVRVAVIDTGLDTSNPQLHHAHVAPGVNVIGGSGTADCDGHGTAVTAIIAAQQLGSSAFVGVAPSATIIPIKQTNKPQDGSGTSSGLARGIDAAIAAHARVANVSLTVSRDYPDVRGAVRRAQRAGLIIVAAVGNQGQHGNRPTWPAMYSRQFANVIAVSASNQADLVPPFPEHGDYVDVAAPGIGYSVPAPHHGFAAVQGTSFAAPYVTGTVALMLAAHRSLTPAQVKRRLELTAAAPPTVAVPDRRFGYGVIDSYLAVTAVLAATPATSSAARAAPVPAPATPAAPGRHLQHVALAVVAVLLVLAALVVAGAAVVRRGASGHRARSGPVPDR